jgi:ABC-type transporter Mla subunit MlaD
MEQQNFYKRREKMFTLIVIAVVLFVILWAIDTFKEKHLGGKIGVQYNLRG